MEGYGRLRSQRFGHQLLVSAKRDDLPCLRVLRISQLQYAGHFVIHQWNSQTGDGPVIIALVKAARS